MQLSRRQFMKVTGSTLAGSSLALMGFSPATALALEELWSYRC